MGINIGIGKAKNRTAGRVYIQNKETTADFDCNIRIGVRLRDIEDIAIFVQSIFIFLMEQVLQMQREPDALDYKARARLRKASLTVFSMIDKRFDVGKTQYYCTLGQHRSIQGIDVATNIDYF